MSRLTVSWDSYHFLLVIVDYLDLCWAAIGPPETDPELSINADAVLTSPVSRKSFKTVSWWRFEVFECFSGVQLIQLSMRDCP